jgi:hypothetical protein
MDLGPPANDFSVAGIARPRLGDAVAHDRRAFDQRIDTRADVAAALSVVGMTYSIRPGAFETT